MDIRVLGRLSEADCHPSNDIGDCKRKKLIEIFDDLPAKHFDTEDGDDDNFFVLRKENTNSGIIFCPHKTYTYGVEDILAYINQKRALFKGISAG